MEKTLELVESGREPRRLSFLAPADAARIQEELDRILSSRTFRSAEREKTFLRYVVDQTLRGHCAEIKEYTVGAEAFGRGDSFDPRRDTIVRTEARNVRLRLDRYYTGEGQSDPIRIELPKGGYTPQFVDSPEFGQVRNATSGAALAAVPEPPLAILPAARRTFTTESLSAERGPGEVPVPRNRRVVLIAAVAIVALAVLWFVGQRRVLRQPASDSASIAVLPFVDLSGGADKDGEILSDGLTEELIDSLARIPRLHVVARSSVFLYKGRTLDIRKVGQELNVRNVLEGSVRVANGHVRITTQLEDTTNGYQLWSQSFDRKLDDAITVQGAISMAIMQSLGVQLAGAANLRTGASPSPAAYRDFLRGLYFLNRSTAENVRTSLNYFQRAVSEDPGFAPAYRGLADGYSRIAVFTSTPTGEMIPRIRAAAEKALQLDDTLGEAHLDLARAYTYEWNWAAAEREYRRALDLSPSSAAVHRYYGDYLFRTGRLEEALAEGRISMELDPISPWPAQFEARMLYYMGRYDEAISQLRKALEVSPSSGILHQALGLVYMSKPASYAQGITETERSRELMEGDPWITGQLGYAYALTGRKAEALAIARRLERGSGGYVRALAVARVYAGLKDREQAFSWLQKAVDQKDVSLFLIADPVYDALRADPRFRVLLRRANLNSGGVSEISMR
jgi:TolB-like protein/Flp pilus assembly protein TadD